MEFNKSRMRKGQKKEKEKEPIEFHRYESDMTPKEKRALEWQKLKGMGIKGKLEYLWAYYKFALAILVLLILVIVAVSEMIENSKHQTILNITVTGAALMEDGEKIGEELAEQFGTGNKYDDVIFDYSYTMTDVESADYTLVMKFTTMVSAQQIDVLITNQEIYEHYVDGEMFLDLSTLFTEEECQRYGIEEGARYLDITDTAWNQNHQWVPYEPVYLTVISNTKNQEKAKEFIIAVEEEEE